MQIESYNQSKILYSSIAKGNVTILFNIASIGAAYLIKSLFSDAFEKNLLRLKNSCVSMWESNYCFFNQISNYVSLGGITILDVVITKALFDVSLRLIRDTLKFQNKIDHRKFEKLSRDPLYKSEIEKVSNFFFKVLLFCSIIKLTNYHFFNTCQNATIIDQEYCDTSSSNIICLLNSMRLKVFCPINSIFN